MADKITSRAKDYSKWYLDIIREAGMAENSDVRGCMVIKPHGFAIWEKMQRALDRMFKDTGHVNAYFPLFIPKSYLAKEEEMAEGFAKECAVITHYRLKSEKGTALVIDPTAKLEEELIVRRGLHGHAGADGAEDGLPEVPRCGADAVYRGPHAGRQGASGGDEPFPGTELCEGVRRAIPEPGRKARVRVGDELGRLDAAH